MIKYIAKHNGWFIGSTELTLVEDCGDAGGLFYGKHRIETDTDAKNRGFPINTVVWDEELCPWDEVEVYTND